MTKSWTIIAGAYGFLAVAFGAFAAHGLQDAVSERSLHAVQTGAAYALAHAVALLALAAIGARRGRMITFAGWAFTLGVTLFSGSLFVFGLTDFRTAAGPLPLITPLGGVLLLAGWLCVFGAGLAGARRTD